MDIRCRYLVLTKVHEPGVTCHFEGCTGENCGMKDWRYILPDGTTGRTSRLATSTSTSPTTPRPRPRARTGARGTIAMAGTSIASCPSTDTRGTSTAAPRTARCPRTACTDAGCATVTPPPGPCTSTRPASPAKQVRARSPSPATMACSTTACSRAHDAGVAALGAMGRPPLRGRPAALPDPAWTLSRWRAMVDGSAHVARSGAARPPRHPLWARVHQVPQDLPRARAVYGIGSFTTGES
jgi:hypothetical protein